MVLLIPMFSFHFIRSLVNHIPATLN